MPVYIEVYPGQSIVLSALLKEHKNNLSAALKTWSETLSKVSEELAILSSKVANTNIKVNMSVDNDMIEFPDMPGSIYESIKDFIIIAPDTCEACGGPLDCGEYESPRPFKLRI